MKFASVFATTVLAVGFSMSGVAIQSAYAAVDAASVTCADFAKMSAADQQAGFDAVKAAMPPATLVTTDSANQKSPNSASGSKPAPSVGMLVSACQADPNDTVMAAVMKAMTAAPATSSGASN
jgi:hypothetical protein